MKISYITAAVVFSVILIGGALFFSNSANTPATENTNIAQAKTIEMYKSPTCGCCTGWAEHMKEEGFAVDTTETTEMMQIKGDNDIPRELESCHTALVGDYVVEGHVPYAAVQKLFEKKPDIVGIGMAGMPAGSPGMGGTKQSAFEVYEITESGERGDLFMRI